MAACRLNGLRLWSVGQVAAGFVLAANALFDGRNSSWRSQPASKPFTSNPTAPRSGIPCVVWWRRRAIPRTPAARSSDGSRPFKRGDPPPTAPAASVSVPHRPADEIRVRFLRADPPIEHDTARVGDRQAVAVRLRL